MYPVILRDIFIIINFILIITGPEAARAMAAKCGVFKGRGVVKGDGCHGDSGPGS